MKEKLHWKEQKQGDKYRISRRDRICAGCKIKKGEKYFFVFDRLLSYCTDTCYGQAFWRE